MTPRLSIPIVAVMLAALSASGCGDRKTSGLAPWPADTDSLVFRDDFGDGVDFQAFLGSNLQALSIDTSEKHEGSASLRVTIPDEGDPDGGWAGGAFTVGQGRDLTGYNALTFWAKSSVPTTLNVAGFGNDNTGTSKYTAQWNGIPLTTGWTKFVIPIPLPSKLTFEGGLFFFAEGPEGPTGHNVWFDDIAFAYVATISNPRPAMTPQAVDAFAGTTVAPQGTQVTFDVDGTDQVIEHMPGYFTFASSDTQVVAIEDGEIHVVGGGSATVTALLGETAVSGELTVNATVPPPGPAATPAFAAGDVISLFSDAYAAVTVDTWSAVWDHADVTDIAIVGDSVKAYAIPVGTGYAGIEFISQTIDASSMTHFHMDVWVAQGTVLKVKLVDFGADGAYQGDPDSESELSFTAFSTPALATGSWVSLDVPLTDFVSLTSSGHMAQLIISGDVGTAFVDNILFHR